MKKVLFVNASLTSGGSEKVMTIIANEFSNKKYDVSMVLVKPSKTENYKLNKSIKCIRINYKHKWKIAKLIERVFKLRKLIIENNYDIIISFMYDINTSTLIASLGTGVPVIVSERCDPASRHINIITRKIEDRLYMRAKKIVLQTEQVKKQYPEYLQSKFKVIPNPISSDIIKKYDKERKHKIVAAGRLTSQKNFKMLIEAFYELQKKYPDYQLFIYGEGPLRESLERIIEELSIQNKVFLPGYVENVNELMNDAKIYVSTSNFEGISNSMLEALAMGIPSICTDCPVGGAAMMIKDHINGILIPIEGKKELINAMLEIIENRELEKKLSMNATNIRKSLDIEQIYKEWEDIIV